MSLFRRGRKETSPDSAPPDRERARIRALVAAAVSPGLEREPARKELAALGERALEPLIEALHDDNDQVRRYAADELSKVESAPAAEALLAVLAREEDSLTASSAALARSLEQVPGAADQLLAALSADQGYLRRNAAMGLGALREKRACERLLELIEDENEDGEVRSSAVSAIGRIGDSRAVRSLIKALDDGRLRSSAVYALGKLGDTAAVEPLIAVLDDESEYVRGGAARALGELGDPRAIEPLIALRLRDEHWSVQADALDALGAIDPAARERAEQEIAQQSAAPDASARPEPAVPTLVGDSPSMLQMEETLRKMKIELSSLPALHPRRDAILGADVRQANEAIGTIAAACGDAGDALTFGHDRSFRKITSAEIADGLVRLVSYGRQHYELMVTILDPHGVRVLDRRLDELERIAKSLRTQLY